MPTWNAMTVARVCRAGLAGLALVILSASLAAAEYGPRIIIGNKYQQWSNVTAPLSEPGSCNNRTFCNILFQPIPQQRPLIVQHLACRVHASDGSLEFVILDGGENAVTDTYLVPVRTSGTWWAVNSPVIHLLKSGERPSISIFNSDFAAVWLADCSISGTLQEP